MDNRNSSIHTSDGQDLSGKIDPAYPIKSVIKVFLMEIVIGTIIALLTWVSIWGIQVSGDFPDAQSYMPVIRISFVILGAFFGAGLLFMLGYSIIYAKRFSYQITDKFIIIHSGVFHSDRTTIPYSRIQNITIHQDIPDKWLKLHTIKIETAGTPGFSGQINLLKLLAFHSSEGYIPGIRNPAEFEKIINKLVNKYTQSPYKGLQGKVFENPDIAFDEFAAYFLRKLQEGGDTQNQVEKIRTEKKLSRQELADKVGVSRQTIYYLEKGKYQPSLKIAMLLAETLGVPITEIFALTSNDRKANAGDV